jgi:DNA (cytosine-5)-methyltransferase 3A
MNVLSLFDGMSCGQIAFDKLGIKFDGVKNKYYAAEIKKSGIKVTKYNYPNTIHIGDVTKISYKEGILYTENGEHEVGEIDYLIGGSPCQDFSVVKLNNSKYGLEGDKSKLFYEYLRLLKEINPKYFLLENVRMKEDSKKQLDKYLGVEGRFINSIDFSFQNRPRFYWTNIDILPYEAKNINFQDYKDTDYEYCKQFKVNKTMSRLKMWNNGNGTSGFKSGCANVTDSEKIFCLTRSQDRCPNSGLIEFEDFCRYLTRRELELAQTVPVGYTNCLSYNQAQDVLGDGWTVDVIKHILKNSLVEQKKETKTEEVIKIEKVKLGECEVEQLKFCI